MKKYILIGIPYSGKSTLGRRLAEKLQLLFFDTDAMVRERENIKSIRDFVRITFSGQFMTAQREVMIELARLEGPAVISTGAEVALMPECASLMKVMGTVIHIQRKPEIILEELKGSKRAGFVKVNPDGTETDMNSHTVKLYAEEISQYEAAAHLTLENNGTEDEGLENLITLLKSIP